MNALHTLPTLPYSASKAASDHLARAYHHTYDLQVTTSRSESESLELIHLLCEVVN
jgi:dTDP-D-glucose 4,6-dehydratase